MDCAGISAWDGDGATELSCRMVLARKKHVCCECGREIDKNDSYERYRLVYDREISEFKTCVDCLSLRDAFFDSWSFTGIWGEFYEYVHEAYGEEIKWSALSKLTDNAKDIAFGYIEAIWNEIEG